MGREKISPHILYIQNETFVSDLQKIFFVNCSGYGIIYNMKKRSFTLLEILLVVAIIGILSAIAIPNYLYPRMRTNESLAVRDLQHIATSANVYNTANGRFPSNLAALANDTPPYIDSILGSGEKAGYRFALTGETNAFTATTMPETYNITGERSYFVDQTGVVRWTDQEATPTASDESIS